MLSLLLASLPSLAWAQAGWYVIPSLRLSEEFDDNILGSSSDRTADWITRLSNGIKAGYRSTPLTVLASTTTDFEKFANHPDRDGMNRLQAGLEFQYVPTRPLTLRFEAMFEETQTPSDLVQNLGLELGRDESRQWSVAPTATYRFDPRTSGEAGYSHMVSVSGEVENRTEEARLRLSRQITQVDSGTAAYTLTLGETGAEAFRSHALTLGWTRRLTPTTTLSLAAGPRLSGGELGTEANAQLSHRFRLGEVSVAYARSETTIPGQTGRAQTQSVSGALRLELLRSLDIVFSPLVSQVKTGQDDTLAEALEISASYRVLRWLSAFARYRFSHSATSGATATGGTTETNGTTIDRNILSIGLEASYPRRAD